ncbi:beta strand repeat-containing protein, partial [Campylobacter jejuni]|uniref:beta strand repeat-containing protein n=1 Tax=Campylobacter jejuni TaxID=197 RepID=UPI000F805422
MKNITLTKTPIGEVKEPCLNSKKIVLSLATISFLASCANAKLNSEIKTYDEVNKNVKTRSASVYSSQSGTSTSINTLQNDTHTISSTGNTLVIGNSGTITISNGGKQAVNFTQGSSTTTFLNQGTLIGGSNAASVQLGANKNNGVTIETFDNQGIIGNGSSKFGITVWGNSDNKSTINNFSNSGTIHSDAGESIYFSNVNISSFANSGTIKSNNGKGVNIVSGVNIQTFNNNGFISGSEGVSLSSGTINSFNNNGTINGNSSGIFVLGGIIQTLENSGTIISNGNYSNHAGIKLENGGSIENIINTGTIESNYSGIMVTYGKFGTLTIKDGGVIHGKYIGIGVGQWQTLGDLYIDGASSKKDGTASGVYGDSYGISLDVGSRTQKIELTNGGVIKGNISGIRLDNGASLSGEMILSGEGSRVEGGSDAGIFNFGGKIEGSITVKDGATVTSSSGQAISNVGSGSITGGITVSGENTKLEGNIINADSASIGSDIKIENGAKVEGGLVNQGNGSISGSVQVSGGSSIDSITNEGNGAISGSITVDKDSKLDSITNTSTSDTGISGSITNNSDNKLEISNGEGATIGGGITNNGNADLVISNQGSVGKDENGNTVTNNGSGSVGIKDWVVSTDKETGKLDTVVVGGSGKDNVKVENITVDQSNVNLEELGNINNIISGVNQGNIGNIGTNGGGEISLSYDPLTGKLSTDYHLNASISGATFRSLISTTSRRSTFIDNVMGNSMQTFALASSSKSQSIAMSEKGNLYAGASDYIKSDLNNGSYGSNKEHSLFILPYTSSQNVELSLNEESKGHTKGTIIGYSTLKDSGIYGVYAG